MSSAHCLIDEFDPKYSAVPLDVDISHVDEYVKRKNHKNDQDHLSSQIMYFKREFGALNSDSKTVATTATTTTTSNTENQNQNQNQNQTQSHTSTAVQHTSNSTQTQTSSTISHTQQPRDNDDHKDEHVLQYRDIREWMSAYDWRSCTRDARFAVMPPPSNVRGAHHRMQLRVHTLSDRDLAHESPRNHNDDDGNDMHDRDQPDSHASSNNDVHDHAEHDGPRVANGANYRYVAPFYNPFLRLSIAPHDVFLHIDGDNHNHSLVINTRNNNDDDDGKQLPPPQQQQQSPIFPLSFYEQNRIEHHCSGARAARGASVMTQTTQTTPTDDGDDDIATATATVDDDDEHRVQSNLRRRQLDHALMHGWHLHEHHRHYRMLQVYNTRRRLHQQQQQQQEQQHRQRDPNHNHNSHDRDGGDRRIDHDDDDIVHDIHNYDLAQTHDMYRVLSAAAAAAHTATASANDIDTNLHLQHNIDLYSANVSRLANILSFTSGRLHDDDQASATAATSSKNMANLNLKHAAAVRFDGLHDFDAALELIPMRLTCYDPLQQTVVVSKAAQKMEADTDVDEGEDVCEGERGESDGMAAIPMSMLSQLSSDVHLIILSMLTGLSYVRTLALWKSLRSRLSKFDISRVYNCSIYKSQALFVERYRQNLFDEKYKAQQAPALHRALSQAPRNLYEFQTDRQSKLLLKRQNSAP